MGIDMTIKPNPLTDPNDFDGPKNVLNELYGVATAANDIAAAKALYDTNFPASPAAAAQAYQFREAVPPRPPPGRPEPVESFGPIPAGRRVVYRGSHVVDADIRKRIRRGYYK